MKKSHYFMQSNQLEASEIYRLEYQTDFDGLYEEYIQPHITGRKSFLDIGCGSGGLLEAIARKKDRLKLVGIDQDKQKTQHTRFKLKNRSDTIVKTAMADQLPFESNSFDLVFSRFVLDHITRREQVIKEMFRVCGKGGKVILQSVDGGLLFHYPE